MDSDRQPPSGPDVTTTRRRPVGPLVSATAKIIALLGLLVVLPINNTVEYAYFDRIVGPLGMLWGADRLLVLALAGSWYGFLWRRVDRKAYPAVRRSRLLAGVVIWAALVYVFLWWAISCAKGLADSAECMAVALLAVAAPTIAYYLTAGAMTSVECWRKGEGVPFGSWLRRWRRILVSTGVVVLVVTVAFWFLWAAPRIRLMSIPVDVDEAEVRSMCHRILWLPGGHDQALAGLSVVGDNSSVPRIIKAMWWVRERSDSHFATTQEAYAKSLRQITNCDAGETHAEWREWYALNRGKSQMEWIAGGFAGDGLAVSAEPSVASARALLEVLGKDSYWRRETVFWRLRNARRLLATYDSAVIDRALDETVGNGSTQEKRGAARYVTSRFARYSTDDGASADTRAAKRQLRILMEDTDRSVRLVASAVFDEMRLRSLWDPTKRVKLRTALRGELVGGRPESGVLYFYRAQYHLAAYDLVRRAVLWEIDIGDKVAPPVLDVGGDVVLATREGRIHRVTSDGTLRWTSSVGQGNWLFKGPARAGDLILVDSGGGGGTVSMHSLEDGKAICRIPGELLLVIESRVVVADGDAVRVVELPGLTPLGEFKPRGRPFGAGLTADVLCIVSADDKGSFGDHDDSLHVEGWSLGTGERLYGDTVAEGRLGDKAVLFDADDGVLYLTTERLTAALRPEDGSIIWESGQGGDFVQAMSVAGDFLVVWNFNWLVFLDRLTGEPLVHCPTGVAGGQGTLVRIANRIYATDSVGELFKFAIPPTGDAPVKDEAP